MGWDQIGEGLYQAAKDFQASGVAIAALAAAIIAYRGVIKKIDAEKDAELERRKAKGRAITAQIAQHAADTYGVCSAFLDGFDEDNYTVEQITNLRLEVWRLSHRTFAYRVEACQSVLDRCWELLPEVDTGSIDELNRKLTVLAHSTFFLRHALTGVSQKESKDRNEWLSNIRIEIQGVRKMLAEIVDKDNQQRVAAMAAQNKINHPLTPST